MTLKDNKKIINFKYNFSFANGMKKEFIINLDYNSLSLIPHTKHLKPKWVELNVYKCPNCNLKTKYCPVAINLTELIDFFKDLNSYDEVDVVVETKDRKYLKHTTMQVGASSIIGIIMVTSGCPIMDKLRPMVDTHLPFMSAEETTYRMISTYLFAQYFLHKKGKKPDWDLKELVNFFEEIRTVNINFCKRLGFIKTGDASLNAVVVLNSLSDFTGLSIKKNKLDRLKNMFSAYDR